MVGPVDPLHRHPEGAIRLSAHDVDGLEVLHERGPLYKGVRAAFGDVVPPQGEIGMHTRFSIPSSAANSAKSDDTRSKTFSE